MRPGTTSRSFPTGPWTEGPMSCSASPSSPASQTSPPATEHPATPASTSCSPRTSTDMRALLLAWLATACAPQDESNCVNEFYLDADGDGHGVPEATVTGCTAPTGYETTHDDCNDHDATIHPGAA